MCLPQLLIFLYNSVYNTALMLKLLLLKSIQFNSDLSLVLVSLISGVRVVLRLVDDPPPLSSILGHHPPVHVLQLHLSHVSLDAIAPSHTWFSSLSLSSLLVNICHPWWSILIHSFYMSCPLHPTLHQSSHQTLLYANLPSQII